jgi:hypothetical protein
MLSPSGQRRFYLFLRFLESHNVYDGVVHLVQKRVVYSVVIGLTVS